MINLIMIYTLNSFINTIQVNFADNHLGIRSFDYGFYDDLNSFATKDEQYAKMYIVVNDVDHLPNSIAQYNIRAYFVDLLENDNDNQNDVLSDQLSISRDFVNWLRLNEESFAILNTPTSVPVRSIGTDYIGGWYTDISLEVPIEGSDCSIPFTGVTGTTIECPPQLTYEVLSDYVSGATGTSVSYMAYALEGTLTSEDWFITRITVNIDGSVTTGTAIGPWDDRYILIYT